MNLGIYVHVPFCRSKCLYCDFCSFPRPQKEVVEAYLSALKRDLLAAAPRADGYLVDTVYFGGGTPTILPPDALCDLLKTLKNAYRVANNAEITLECNPNTHASGDFEKLREAGFNRLSVGLQSVHPNELKALGRTHDFADFCRTFSDARQAGFDNISADVMSGIPLQTPTSYRETLSRLTDLSPDHISAYGLIVEESTPFKKLCDGGKLALPSEEDAERMYFEGIEVLARAGYRQYEISNFAKDGKESRHNLKYWNCLPFLGFGPAAYSDFEGERVGNSRDLEGYLDGKNIVTDRERAGKTERMNEYVMLRMRLCEGVVAAEFEAKFGENFDQTFGDALRKYEKDGFVRDTGHGVAFTPRGMYVSNAILSEVLDFTEK